MKKSVILSLVLVFLLRSQVIGHSFGSVLLFECITVHYVLRAKSNQYGLRVRDAQLVQADHRFNMFDVFLQFEE